MMIGPDRDQEVQSTPGMTELEPEVRELTQEDAERVRGGQLAAPQSGKLNIASPVVVQPGPCDILTDPYVKQ